MKTIFAAVLALACLVTPAMADECATVATVNTDVANWHNGSTVVPFDHLQTQAFLADFNARPPRSDMAADTMLVVSRAGAPVIVVALFQGECVSKTLFIPADVFNELMVSL